MTLALGYTRTRLHGVIVSFEVRPAAPGAAAELYGVGTPCAVIGVAVDPPGGP